MLDTHTAVPSDLSDETAGLSKPSAWLAGGGEMGALVRSLDWSKTALGPLRDWPQSLRTTVSTCLSSRFPILIWWGKEFVKIYNDAYMPMLGQKHPRALGQRGAECWPEVWSVVGPMLKGVVSEGKATWSENQQLIIDRNGFLEEAYFTFSYSPIRHESGGIGGVFCAVTETTAQVLGERRLLTLRAIGQRTAEATSVEQACTLAADVLGENAADLPFALIYLADDESHGGRLVATAGVSNPERLSKNELEIARHGDWPLELVLRTGKAMVIDQEGIVRGLGAMRSQALLLPKSALLLPIALTGAAGRAGALIVGLSSRLPLNDQYRHFLDLVAGQLATALGSARSLEAAEQRAASLAEIDRAKTAFFSNVSHELRTPLTLMLGPTEDALASKDGALRGRDLETVHRNELRLLKLVNTLLDFARSEAGRAEAAFAPTDITALTREIASGFRSTIERGGLRFEVHCEPIDGEVYIDRDMWEKIVLNLLSNAFKFTFAGEITVALRRRKEHVQLAISDSGVGISAAELPRVFERFHRIEGTRSRTYEGTGIGLALVRDLVRLHSGEISVESRQGQGTTFTVSIPMGTAHLSAARISAPKIENTTAGQVKSFVGEAMRWLPSSSQDDQGPPALATGVAEPLSPSAIQADNIHIIVADDNADMREYVARLLRQHWQVDTVADGEQALALARSSVPSLVLADVMMPNLDGFGLLRALRSDPLTASVPVLMLSAQAGEGPRVDGLAAGAADYLIKPFSARELIARVAMHLELGRLRRVAEADVIERVRSADERERLLAERESLHAEREQLLLRESASRREAEAASRAKDEFLAMLGHELRNPLAPIVTALHLLRLHRGGTAEPELTIIERQVKHLTVLVDDLLDVSRITQGKIELKREQLELSTVIARALEIANPFIEQRRHNLVVDVPRHGIIVDADAGRLAQVISNLLHNAAKYMETGGRIALTAAVQDGHVALSVKDSGLGIEAQMLPRVFDIFMQERQASDRASGGLGLGLAIVRSLVGLHGGTVSAASAGRGTGSTFTIRLPLVASADRLQLAAPVIPLPRAVPIATPAQISQVAVGARRRVLIVDDNIDAAEMLTFLMKKFGCDTRVAHDGPSALAILDGFQPEIGLLDIGLPGMDGYELAQQIRARTDGASIHLVAITGYGQKSDIERSLAAGFDEHFVKPVDINKLRALLAHLLTPDQVAVA